MAPDAYNTSAFANVTADFAIGSWTLSMGPHLNFRQAVGSRKIEWRANASGHSLPDGRYFATVAAPKAGKSDSDDFIIDSTPPVIEKVTLTDIEDLVNENKCIYTFRVDVKDPEVNGVASGLDVASALVTQSNVHAEAFGVPKEAGNGAIELKVKLDAIEVEVLDYQIGIKDLAGNYLNHKTELSVGLSMAEAFVEPAELTAEPLEDLIAGSGNSAYQVQVVPAGVVLVLPLIPHIPRIVTAGQNAIRTLPLIARGSMKGSLGSEARQQQDAALNGVRDKEAALAIAAKQREQEREEGLDVISLDDLNPPFYYALDPVGIKYHLGVGFFDQKDKKTEIQASAAKIPATVTFTHRPTQKRWLSRDVVVTARYPIGGRGKGGLLGNCAIIWNGENQFGPEKVARAGQYNVEVKLGHAKGKKIVRPGFKGQDSTKSRILTGFGVINNQEKMTFGTFREFKAWMGPAGKGYEWHHIVEQKTFRYLKDARIQSMQNLVRIYAPNHRKISGYYSSKPAFTGGMTYRNWLETAPATRKSFDEQYKLGVTHMREKGIWDFALQSSTFQGNGVQTIRDEDDD
jgi:hypothetical protein